jgi:hypothetical protein
MIATADYSQTSFQIIYPRSQRVSEYKPCIIAVFPSETEHVMTNVDQIYSERVLL